MSDIDSDQYEGEELPEESDDDGDMYIDRKGFCHCSAHRREACNECFVDHRMTNMLHAKGDWNEETYFEVNAKMEQMQRAETAAVLAERARRGGAAASKKPLVMGSQEHIDLSNKVTEPPPSARCAACGKAPKKLSVCSVCKAARYCNTTCQRQHWSQHKALCAAQKVEFSEQGKVLSFAKLDKGKCDGLLELRVMSITPYLRLILNCKDRDGEIRCVTFYCDRPPQGVAPGKILRWRNPPPTHYFMDGQVGLRVEDDDVNNITLHSS